MRALWLQIHRWLGLTLGALGVLVGLSGSVLVFDQRIDALLNPQHYAVSDPRPALGFAQYAEAAAGSGRAVGIRLPDDTGGPVIVTVRAREGDLFHRVYLDPTSGRVLGSAPGGGFIGWAHRFHESLALREYWGRGLVGLVGAAMLASSLSGIYLWWPGRRRMRQAFGLRPGLATSRNLHYVLGLYLSLALALLSFTGLWLAYADAGRRLAAAFGPLSPAPRSVQAPEAPGTRLRLPPDAAVDAARTLYPDATVTSLGLPGGPRGVYRVNLRRTNERIAVFVSPASGAVLWRTDGATQTSGDAFLALQRALHSGETFGLPGRVLFFLTGLLPAILVGTGTMMWLRERRRATISPAAATADQPGGGS